MSFLKYQTALILFFVSCGTLPNKISQRKDYRTEMRNFVINISEHAKSKNPSFAIIPQNGIELITDDGTPDGRLSSKYLNAIDGHGQEELFYGYNRDNKPTPHPTTKYLKNLLQVSQGAGNKILVIDYTNAEKKINDSQKRNSKLGFTPFVATERSLTNIPDVEIPNKNANNISLLKDVKNFLFFINPDKYEYKEDYLEDIAATDYDMVIIDLFFHGDVQFTAQEIEKLKTKKNGAKRMVCCYMSIGEAEDYRYYWQKSWKRYAPSWLDMENKNWKGNYKVKYWDKSWQKLVLGNPNSYLDKILSSGFDGVYLDIIDAYEHFENQ